MYAKRIVMKIKYNKSTKWIQKKMGSNFDRGVDES